MLECNKHQWNCFYRSSSVLTLWFPIIAGDLSVQLPLRPAAHGADLLQAAVMEEATPDEEGFRLFRYLSRLIQH